LKVLEFLKEGFAVLVIILVAFFFGLVECLVYLERRKEARKRGLPEPEEDYFDYP